MPKIQVHAKNCPTSPNKYKFHFTKKNKTRSLFKFYVTWSSSVGDIRRGRIWLNSGPAPNSRALSVIWRKAAFLMGGVPFLIFSKSFMIFLSFNSSGLRVLSSTSTCWYHEAGWDTAQFNKQIQKSNIKLFFPNRTKYSWVCFTL